MSSTASELNALAATTTIDLYKRNHNQKKSEKHYLVATKLFTVMWGIIAGYYCDNFCKFWNIIRKLDTTCKYYRFYFLWNYIRNIFGCFFPKKSKI